LSLIVFSVYTDTVPLTRLSSVTTKLYVSQGGPNIIITPRTSWTSLAVDYSLFVCGTYHTLTLFVK